MTFNNVLAVLIVLLVFTFVFIAAWAGWNHELAMIALGVFLAKLSDVVQFYFRKARSSG